MDHYMLSASVTPILLISACGLTTPPVYSRLRQIVSRIHSFDHHKFELMKNFKDGDDDERKMLLSMLDSQIAQVATKAKVVRKGLYCLLWSAAAFCLCLLLVEAASFADGIGLIAVVTGIVGTILFVWGVGLTIPELQRTLPPLEEEVAYLEFVKTHHLAKRQRWSQRYTVSGNTVKSNEEQQWLFRP